MGLGIALFLLAVGAVLTFAVTATVGGVNIATIGIILMLVGGLGIVLDLILFAPRRRRMVYDDPYADAYDTPPAAAPRRERIVDRW
jgi:hypothetical protein